MDALDAFDPSIPYKEQYPKLYVSNPQTETEWHHVGNVVHLLTNEMMRMMEGGAIIAGGAALGLLRISQECNVNDYSYFGDVDYYVTSKDLTRLSDHLQTYRLAEETHHRGGYTMVLTFQRGFTGDMFDEELKFNLGENERKIKPRYTTPLPTEVPHPKIYRRVVGTWNQPAATFDSYQMSHYQPPMFKTNQMERALKDNTIDVIPTDCDPRDYIAREFDITICKTYVDKDGDVYSMFPEDISDRRFSHSFHPMMSHNRSKIDTMAARQLKYMKRGYSYYERSCLHKLNFPSLSTFSTVYTDNPEAGRIVTRVMDVSKSDQSEQRGLFSDVVRQIVSNNSCDGKFKYGGVEFEVELCREVSPTTKIVVELPHRVRPTISSFELELQSYGMEEPEPPTINDIELAHRMIDVYEASGANWRGITFPKNWRIGSHEPDQLSSISGSD